MACSACEAAKAANLSNNRTTNLQSNYTFTGPCEYTDEILNVWLDKLKWFKDKGIYVKYKIEARLLNKYLGIVLTSLNVNNKCTYKTTLDEIAKLIVLINGLS